MNAKGMLEFAKSEPYTLGVEVELQIVDRDTLDLTPKATTFLEEWKGEPRVQPEIFQSMLEISTGVCADAAEAERQLRDVALQLLSLARSHNVRFIATGTHPTAGHRERRLFPAERYDGLITRNQWIARRLLIFGLHVHIGMKDAHTCIAIQNEIMRELGMLLAASTSSPFWHAEATGLASSRITVFEALPTGGQPALVESWDEFCQLVEILLRANAIESLKDLWWDIRPSPRYGTLEIRVCDGLASIRETAAIVALIQALARRAGARVEAGTARPAPPMWLLRENKWRASRHGMNADYLIDEFGTSMPVRQYLLMTLEDLIAGGYADPASQHMQDIRSLASGAPTSSERQRAVYERTGSFDEVTRSIAEEFEQDLMTGVAP
jgi:glutamate---cysteine ligase / carboxylate-amine ligase